MEEHVNSKVQLIKPYIAYCQYPISLTLKNKGSVVKNQTTKLFLSIVGLLRQHFQKVVGGSIMVMQIKVNSVGGEKQVFIHDE